jgi:hypothetical protein
MTKAEIRKRVHDHREQRKRTEQQTHEAEATMIARLELLRDEVPKHMTLDWSYYGTMLYLRMQYQAPVQTDHSMLTAARKYLRSCLGNWEDELDGVYPKEDEVECFWQGSGSASMIRIHITYAREGFEDLGLLKPGCAIVKEPPREAQQGYTVVCAR